MNDEIKIKNETKEINRRKFFTIVGNTAVGVAAVGGLGITFDYLSPNVVLEVPKKFRVGPVANIQPNTVIFNPEYRVFIFRDEKGYFFAVSAICTHLGCTSNWKPEGALDHQEGVIACPCHGSIFSKTGNVLLGPATRALDRFHSYLQDGQLIVDTEVIVSEEEMILKV